MVTVFGRIGLCFVCNIIFTMWTFQTCLV